MREAKGLADAKASSSTSTRTSRPTQVPLDDQRFGGSRRSSHFAEQGLIGRQHRLHPHEHLSRRGGRADRGSGMALVWQPGQLHVLRHLADRQQRRMPELLERGVNLDARHRHRQGLGVRRPGLHRLSGRAREGRATSRRSRSSRCSRSAARARWAWSDELGSLEVGKRADIVIRTATLPEAPGRQSRCRQLSCSARTKASTR